MQLAASADARGGRQRLDLLSGHVGVGGVKVHRTDKMRRSPFDESVYVGGDRNGGRIVHMLEDRVKHRSRELGEIGHELIEFAVEIAEKQQGFFAQKRKARVVD